jgi:DDE_Tnp_1-associated
MQIQSLYDVYRSLPDSRAATGKRFNQAGVLALITLALIAQQNSLRQITAWVAACDRTLSARLRFRINRMPSYDTILTGDSHYTTREVIRTIREKRGTTSYGSKTTSRGCSAR